MINIEINTSSRYEVLMGEGLLGSSGDIVCRALGLSSGEGTRLGIISDENVTRIYGGDDSILAGSLRDAGFSVHCFSFPGGEHNKNLDTVSNITDFLCENHFTRSDALVAFGGGITGDITGFAASIYMRGIPFIQVPSTLLSAVDSSVGGKTGVNNSYGKNLIGAFHQPAAVIFDPALLKTLSRDLLLDGMAEMLKAGFIGDMSIVSEAVGFGEGLLSDGENLTRLVAKAVAVKRDIVAEDEKEKGNRRLLNLGHTIAHSIETLSYFSISHGHAVAMGMRIIARAAAAQGWTDPAAGNMPQITDEVLNAFAFPEIPDFSAEDLTRIALHDKKAHGGSVSIVYPYRPGECRIIDVENNRLEAVIASGLCTYGKER